MKTYIRLLRMKHYIKNLLIFLPLFFGRALSDRNKLISAVLGFVAFSFLSSAVYIFNDRRDAESDRLHPTKRNRPIASGEISFGTARILFFACLAIALLLSVAINSLWGGVCLLVYLLINMAYSLGWKNVPVLDVVLLASGFVLRVFYGGIITNIEISDWLYLVVISASLYLGLGKRRNELKNNSDQSRKVLQFYTVSFLEKNMYVCVALTNVFYALWALESGYLHMVWTVPLFMVLLLCYSLITEGDSDGDPVEVVLHHPYLVVLGAGYALCMGWLLYLQG